MGFLKDWAGRTARDMQTKIDAAERRDHEAAQQKFHEHVITQMGQRSVREPSALTQAPPLVVGVFGPALAGKTTLIQRLQSGLNGAGPLVSALPRWPGLTLE